MIKLGKFFHTQLLLKLFLGLVNEVLTSCQSFVTKNSKSKSTSSPETMKKLSTLQKKVLFQKVPLDM